MAPKLTDIQGRQYNPRKALAMFERLEAGEIELLQNEVLKNNIRRGLTRDYPLEPDFHPGRYGHQSDSYTCGNCGFTLGQSFYKYCPNCGQKLTNIIAGKRASQEETERYWEV